MSRINKKIETIKKVLNINPFSISEIVLTLEGNNEVVEEIYPCEKNKEQFGEMIKAIKSYIKSNNMILIGIPFDVSNDIFITEVSEKRAVLLCESSGKIIVFFYDTDGQLRDEKICFHQLRNILYKMYNILPKIVFYRISLC